MTDLWRCKNEKVKMYCASGGTASEVLHAAAVFSENIENDKPSANIYVDGPMLFGNEYIINIFVSTPK